MCILGFPLLPIFHVFRCAAQVTLRGLLVLGVLLALCEPIQASGQEGPVAAPQDEFASLVELAPLVVGGQALAIAIYARTNADRRYGEQFAERVVKVVHEAVTESTGRGLVIIG